MKTVYTTDATIYRFKPLVNASLFVDIKARSLDLKRAIYTVKARTNAMKAQKKIAFV
jgi:hypothetical protein